MTEAEREMWAGAYRDSCMDAAAERAGELRKIRSQLIDCAHALQEVAKRDDSGYVREQDAHGEIIGRLLILAGDGSVEPGYANLYDWADAIERRYLREKHNL